MGFLGMYALTAAILMQGASAGAEAAMAVPVLLVDVAGVGPVALDVMASEVSSVLGPSGMHLAWHRVKPGEEHDRRFVRAVILGERSCGSSVGTGESTLASANPAREGTTVSVCLPNLLIAARLAAGSDRPSSSDQHRLGVALGRVIVHELVHLAAPAMPHAKRGLFSPSLDRPRLVDGSGFLDAAAQESLRRAATRWWSDRP